MSVAASVTPYVPDPAVFPSAVRLPIVRSGRVRFDFGSANVSTRRVSLATFTFKEPLPTVETQRSLMLGGAAPSLYDGEIVHEAGFNWFPEVVALAAAESTTGAGGLTLTSTYSYVFLYEWEDKQGATHRSASSVPFSFLLTGANETLTVRIPHLRLTDKQEAGQISETGVRIVAYRTEGNGELYYREGSVKNDLGSLTSATWVSTLTDAVLITNELLPTTGGLLENQAFPSTNIVCKHQRRVFMVTQNDPNTIQYTDEIDEQYLAPATNEAYRLRVPSEGGSIVGLSSMDEKLIIICQRQIYYVFGDGPDRLGQNNSYSLPQICSTKLGGLGGCHESLALTPDGLWFLSSARGLRLLTRGLAIAMQEDNFLGVESDDMLPATVTIVRAATIDSKSAVRWYFGGSEESTGIVWNYAERKWSKFTNHFSSGGVVAARGAYYHSDGSALYSSDEAAGTADAGTNNTPVLETAWIAVGGIQGFQRVYVVALLLEAVGESIIKLEVGYDYSDTYSTEAFFSSAAIDPLQIAHHLTRQKCMAVRFRLTLANGTVLTAGSVGSGFSFTAAAGALAEGDIVTGGTSGATATVSSVASVGDVVGIVVVSASSGAFTLGETLTADAWTATAGLSVRDLVVAPSAGSVPSVGALIVASDGAPSRTLQAVAVQNSQMHMLLSGGGFAVGDVLLAYYSTGEVARLTGMSLTVGVKQGLNRLPAAKRF
jgi:hypothetical protein